MRDVFAKLFKAVGLYLRHFVILWVLAVLIALEPAGIEADRRLVTRQLSSVGSVFEPRQRFDLQSRGLNRRFRDSTHGQGRIDPNRFTGSTRLSRAIVEPLTRFRIQA